MVLRKYLIRGGFLVLTFAIALHLIWGHLLVLSPIVLNTTPMAYLLRVMSQDLAGVTLILASVSAIWGLKNPGWWGLLAASPQNFLLFIAATSGLVSAMNGHYPDGVERHGHFILVDQLPMILFAFLHASCLAVYHGLKHRWEPTLSR